MIQDPWALSPHSHESGRCLIGTARSAEVQAMRNAGQHNDEAPALARAHDDDCLPRKGSRCEGLAASLDHLHYPCMCTCGSVGSLDAL